MRVPALRMNLVWNAPDGAGGAVARAVTGRIESTIGGRALAQAVRWRRRLSEHGEEDANWDWARFLEERTKAEKEGVSRHARYSLWALGRLQALMILEISGRFYPARGSRLPQVYVEYLAVAPDNRPAVRHPRVLRGCGAALLRVAVRASLRLGWEGRVALHSLPGAKAFYEGQGFRDLGSDPSEEGYHYMEIVGKL